MNRLTNIVKFMILLLLVVSCDEVINEHSPQVIPEIVSIGPDTAIIKWNNVGKEYYYSVWISQDTNQDNSFYDAVSVCDSTNDTIFTIRGLNPKTFYKIKIRTNGGNKSPNESWPPLRFKTENAI